MKRLFVRGLLGALPIVLVLAFVVSDAIVVGKIVRAGSAAVESAADGLLGIGSDPAWAWFFEWGSIPVSLLLALLPLLAAAAWMSTRAGRRLYARVARAFERIPALGLIVQFARAARRRIDRELVRGERGSVVLVPFEGAFSLGLITAGAAGPDGFHWVLIPSSPFGLFSRLVLVPAGAAIRVDLPVEAVFRVAGSLGFLPADYPGKGAAAADSPGLGRTTSPDSGSIQ